MKELEKRKKFMTQKQESQNQEIIKSDSAVVKCKYEKKRKSNTQLFLKICKTCKSAED